MKKEDKTRNIVMLVNIQQVSKYIQNGVKPLDIYYTDRLVFAFDKDETSDLFERWKNYTL